MKSANPSFTAIVVLTAVLMVLVGYQNCAPVEFDQPDPALNEKGQGDEDLVLEPIDDGKEDQAKDGDKGKDIAKDKDKDKNKEKKCQKTSCGDFSDVQLTVVAIEINDASGRMQLVPVRPVVLGHEDIKNGVEFEVDRAVQIRQVRMVLASDGNFMVDENGKKAFALKTPSAQQSGLKFKVNFNAQPGVYKLKADLDFNRQIVATKKTCIFKPVIHQAMIVSAGK